MSGPHDDPYAILGVKRGADAATIRARYLELAKKHHPDKVRHLPVNEQLANEEMFKKVVAAYQYIQCDCNNTKGYCGGDGDGDGDGNSGTYFRWKEVWDKWVGHNTIESLASAFQNVAVEVIRNTAAAATTGGVKKYKAPITLLELHENKQKVFRVWVGQKESMKKPLVCTVLPHEFLYSVTSEVEVFPGVFLVADIKDGPVYHSCAENAWDLEIDIEIDLMDYLLGCKRELPMLGEAGEYEVILPPYYEGGDMRKPLIIDGKGLAGRGNLRIYWNILLPKNATDAREKLHTITVALFDSKI